MPEGINATISIRLQPGARRNELVEIRQGMLLARVTAPPLEGRANRALCRLVAERLGVAPSRVAIVRGHRSREKLLRVDGIAHATVDAALRL
jgi:uncharacterized protein (TIGR00251 family)